MSKAYQSIPAPSGDQRRIVADGRGKLLNSVGVTVAVVKDRQEHYWWCYEEKKLSLTFYVFTLMKRPGKKR
jgi:hypothetical protein